MRRPYESLSDKLWHAFVTVLLITLTVNAIGLVVKHFRHPSVETRDEAAEVQKPPDFRPDLASKIGAYLNEKSFPTAAFLVGLKLEGARPCDNCRGLKKFYLGSSGMAVPIVIEVRDHLSSVHYTLVVGQANYSAGGSSWATPGPAVLYVSAMGGGVRIPLTKELDIVESRGGMEWRPITVEKDYARLVLSGASKTFEAEWKTRLRT